jgi:hypothetical protein
VLVIIQLKSEMSQLYYIMPWSIGDYGMGEEKEKLVHPINPFLLVAGVRNQLPGLKPQSNLSLCCLRAITSMNDVSDIQVTQREYKEILRSRYA